VADKNWSSTPPSRKVAHLRLEANSSSTATGLIYALGEQGVGDVEETGDVGPIQVVAGVPYSLAVS
jgi:hypothetical protein